MSEGIRRKIPGLNDHSRDPEDIKDYLDAEAEGRIIPHAIEPELVRGRRGTDLKRGSSAVLRKPQIAVTLDVIDNILWLELRTLEDQARAGALTEEGMRRFAKLAEVALKKSKEDREMEAQERFDEMSREELKAAVAQALKVLDE